jgi:hypothetical protein
MPHTEMTSTLDEALLDISFNSATQQYTGVLENKDLLQLPLAKQNTWLWL